MARLQKVEDGSFFDTRVKSSKAVRAYTIKLLNLEPAKHEVENIQWMFV